MYYSTEDFDIGQSYERTDFKVKYDVEVRNVAPRIIAPTTVDFLPDRMMELPLQISDQGSDD